MAKQKYLDWLWTWGDGDNPGAGSPTVNNEGLNGQWIKIADAILPGHTTAGGHKTDVIDKTALNNNCADGSTLERDTTNKFLKVKAGGITATQLAPDAVTTVKIADAQVTTNKILDAQVTAAKLALDSVTTTRIADAQVTTNKILDANVTVAKLAPDSVTTVKIMDGAVTDAKIGADINRGYEIYNNSRAAATTAGATPSAASTWVETSDVYVKKISAFFVKKVWTKRLYLGFQLRHIPLGDSAHVQWGIAGGITTSWNTISDAFASYYGYLDISALTNDTIYEVEVYIKVGASGTTEMRYPIIELRVS